MSGESERERAAWRRGEERGRERDASRLDNLFLTNELDQMTRQTERSKHNYVVSKAINFSPCDHQLPSSHRNDLPFEREHIPLDSHPVPRTTVLLLQSLHSQKLLKIGRNESER